MRIERLSAEGFRNYDFLCFEPAERMNALCGDNAQGKTNLIEAVYYLSLGKSFRTRFDREIISFGCSCSNLLAEISSHGRSFNVRVRLSRSRPKEIKVNSVERRAGELAEIFSVVLFSPADLSLVQDGAAGRRRFLDEAISVLRPRYGTIISEYAKNLDQKNAILRDYRSKPSLLDVLDEYSLQLAGLSAKIIRYRASFIKKLEEEAEKLNLELSSGKENLSFGYETISEVKDPLAGYEQVLSEVLVNQSRLRRAELECQRTLDGVHRDELRIFINGEDARSYASQGQARSAAISMKLALREILLSERDDMPMLLLDDVLSELDPMRQEFLLGRIEKGQTILSACSEENLEKLGKGKVFYIEDGKIKNVYSSG